MIDKYCIDDDFRQIFVSYARDDNLPPPDEPKAKGFVTFLHELLDYELKQLGYPRPRLFRDTEHIERGEQFEIRLNNELFRSSIIVIVLSRNWTNQHWCQEELSRFAKQRKDMLQSELLASIVVVAKNYIPPGRRPILLEGQEGYNFFWIDPENCRESGFFDRGKIVDNRYVDRVKELAAYLWNRTQDKAHRSLQETAIERSFHMINASAVDCRTIYLASPAGDVIDEYDMLARELVNRGYRVLPPVGSSIPSKGTDACAYIEHNLAQAELSIHLLATKLGWTPEDSQPIATLQLARAAARDGATIVEDATDPRRFHRLIWAPRLNAGAERRPEAILAEFGTQLDGDKLVGELLMQFVQFVIQHLEATRPRPSPVELSSGDGVSVYVEHDRSDAEFAVELAAQLQEAGFDALLPAYDGDESERRRLHAQYLVDCDGVVLCWANTSEVWVKAQAMELKWDKLNRDKRFNCRGVVAGPPPLQPKNTFRRIPPRAHVDVVVDATGSDAPSPAVLLPLIDRLRAEAG